MGKRSRNHSGFEERMEKFQEGGERFSEPLRPDTGIFWWCSCLEEGRRYVIGPFNSEEEAYEKGYAKIDGDFDVIALRTRDTATATQMLKARAMKKGQTLQDATARARHQGKGVDY